MTLECVHNNNIAVFVVQYNHVVGPMARPGARGLGPGLGLKYDNCVTGRAGPGNTFCWSGPGLIIQFAGRARARSAQLSAAGPGRTWASNHICGPGLGLHFRPVQGPTQYYSTVSWRWLQGRNEEYRPYSLQLVTPTCRCLGINTARRKHESHILHSIYTVQNEDVERIIIHANDTEMVVICVYYASTLLRDVSELWSRTARERYLSAVHP